MKKYFKNNGLIINGLINLSPKEAYDECKNGAIIIDMRRDYEYAYKQFDVENTFYMTYDDIKENYKEIIEDKPLIIADQAGVHSKEITKYLMDKGFINVANLSGGMFEWDKDDMPLRINPKEMLSGSCLCVLRKKS